MKDYDKILDIQNRIDRNKYHLTISTDLTTYVSWKIFKKFEDFDTYMSADNTDILNSYENTVEELEKYLEENDGFR